MLLYVPRSPSAIITLHMRFRSSTEHLKSAPRIACSMLMDDPVWFFVKSFVFGDMPLEKTRAQITQYFLRTPMYKILPVYTPTITAHPDKAEY